MVYFVCPDLPHPSGGQRVIYRHVNILNAAGIAAAVLHRKPGFRDRWFPEVTAATPVCYMPAEVKPGRDVLVFPELAGPDVATIAPGVKKVMFVQCGYFMFQQYSEDPRDVRTPYTHPDVVAAIVVSEDSRQYIKHVFPQLRVHRVRNSVDAHAFLPAGDKKRQLCYMPRKFPGDAQQVINILKFRKALRGFDVVPIDRLPTEQVRQIIRESAVFLSFGHPEGFGLPPAEAMAARCVVVGYHGFGGREYFRPEHGFPIELGDVLTYARTVEDVIARLDCNPDTFEDLTNRAARFITSTYTQEVERADVLGFWRDFLLG